MTNREQLLKMIENINTNSHHTSELEPADERGIEWCWVGHNASHEFELGVDQDDKLWARSSCEEWDTDMPEQPENETDEEFFKRLAKWELCEGKWVTSEPYEYKGGYIGHW